LNTPPYQEAMPWSNLVVLESAGFCGASKSGVALAIETAEVAVTAGRERAASACTVRVESVTTRADSATDDAPANSQVRSGVFELVSLVSRRLTIYLFY
jgi:hypothetical protein